ncbi:hypothetical protein GCM10023156_00020 [Novipirellula rosea]|uniref:Big-1 domain-containing protein n=2 Tax=Novipirellula rosea TaxID=1031540 RepID=A0ABP8M2A3_9BACT
MLPVAPLALLGDADGVDDGGLVGGLTQTTGNDPAGGVDTPGYSEASAAANDGDFETQFFNETQQFEPPSEPEQSLLQPQRPATDFSSSPSLLQGISTELAGSFLDESADAVDSSESTSQIDTTNPIGNTSGGSNDAGGAGTLKAPISEPVDSAGSTGQALEVNQPPDGGSGGSGNGEGESLSASSSNTSTTTDVATAGSPSTTSGPTNIDPISGAPPDLSSQPNALPELVEIGHQQLIAAAGFFPQGPQIEVATLVDSGGPGRFIVTGQGSESLHDANGRTRGENRDLIDAYVIREGVTAWLGQTTVKGNGDFRVMGFARLYQGDQVIVHQHDGSGALGQVSDVYHVQVEVDSDGDGVADLVESLANAGDGNADGGDDAQQRGVASLPDHRFGKMVSIDAKGKGLGKVRNIAAQSQRNDNYLPLGLFDFEVQKVGVGQVHAIDVYLPNDLDFDGWYKEDPISGRLLDFRFDGTTGAVRTEFGFTLYLQDGGRGDDDGIANGVIVDPSGPGIIGSIPVGLVDVYDNWSDFQQGGSEAGAGRVDYTSGVYATEGDSFLVSVQQSIEIPSDPTWLTVGFQVHFDDGPTGRINDAFEIALLDQNGVSLVPTHEYGRDSMLNITERAATTLVDSTLVYGPAISIPAVIDNEERVTFFPDPQRSSDEVIAGYVDVDISDFIPGQVVNVVMRLVNNDGDTGSWFRLVRDLPVPAALKDTFSINQDSVLNSGSDGYYPLLSNDDDGDLEYDRTLTVVSGSVTNPANGTVSVQPDGQFGYTPNPGFVGTDSFTYRVSNGIFETPLPATVTVNVERVNHPPLANDDSFGPINEDSSIAVSVLSNDTDPDPGTGLAITHVDGIDIAIDQTVSIDNANVTLEVDPQTGQAYLTVSPHSDYFGPIDFSYTISDGEYSDVAVVTGAVNSVNDPPVNSTEIPNQNGQDAADAIELYLRNYFSDIDQSGPLTIDVSNLPAGLAFNSTTATVGGTFDAAASAQSPYLVTVTATDTGNETISVGFEWTVTNPSPLAYDDEFETDQDTIISRNLFAANPTIADTDDDAIHVSAVNGVGTNVGQAISGSNGGLFTITSAGEVQFNPYEQFDGLNQGQFLITSVSYTLTDAQGASNTAQVTVTVFGNNDAPIPVGTIPDQTGVDAQGATNVDVTPYFQDPDGDTLTYEAINLPPGLAIDDVTGVISGTFDHEASLESAYAVTVRAIAGDRSASQTFAWTVDNPVPTAADHDFGSLAQGATVTLNVLNGAVDADGDSISLVAIDGVTIEQGDEVQVSGGTVTVGASGSISFTADSRFEGAVSFSYTIFDGLNTDDAMVSGTVFEPNLPPVAKNDWYPVAEEATLVVTSSDGVLTNDTDPNGDSLTVIELVSGVSHGTLSPPDANGAFSYTPNTDFVGTDSFVYKISDGSLTSQATVTIHVTNVNDPPIAVDDSYDTDEDVPLIIAAPGILQNDSDVDGDPLQIERIEQPELGTVEFLTDSEGVQTGAIRYVPYANTSGIDTFTYRLFDGAAYSSIATVTIDIDTINDAPIAQNDGYVVDAGQTLTIPAASGLLANDNDADGDPITVYSVTSISPSGSGTWNHLADGSFNFTPAANFDGQATLEYVITDGVLQSAAATVTITVNSPLEYAKFFVPDHSKHEVFRYDDGGGLIDRWDYDTNNRARGATANAAGDRLWIVTAGHDVVVFEADGTEIGKWQARVNSGKNKTTNLNNAEGIATNGTDLWIVDNSKKLKQILHFDGGAALRSGQATADGMFSLHPENKNPSGLTTDGTNLYVTDDTAQTTRVFVYNIAGQHLGNWYLNLGPGNHDVQGITTNPAGGTELWVVDAQLGKSGESIGIPTVHYFPYGTDYRNGTYSSSHTFNLDENNKQPYGIADPIPPATVTWDGPANGDWNVASYWSPDGVPDASDDVSIPSGTIVDINSPAEAKSLQGAGTVRLLNSNAQLTLANESEINGLTMNRGLIDGAGDLTVNGSFNWSGGKIDGSGVLFVASGATGTLTGYDQKVLDRDLRNSGTLTWDNGTLMVDDDSVDPYGGDPYGGGTGGLGDDTAIIKFVNESGGVLNITGTGFARYLSSGASQAYDSNTQRYIATHPPLFENDGTINHSFAGTTYIATDFNNDQAVNVLSGKLLLEAAGTSTGDFDVAASASLKFNPKDQLSPLVKQSLTSTSTISGDGTAVFSRGPSEIDGSVTIDRIQITSGEAIFNSSPSVQEIVISGGEAVFNANLSVPVLRVSDGVVEGPADLTVTGTLDWSGGRIDGNGDLIIASTAAGTLSGNAVKVLDRNLHNSGALDWNQGEWRIDVEDYGDAYGGDPYGGGTGGLGDDSAIIQFVNEPGGTLHIGGTGWARQLTTWAAAQYDSQTNEYVVSHPPLIDNQGTITQTYTSTTFIAPRLENKGTVDVQAGKLQLDGSGISTGDFTVAAGAILQFDPSGEVASSSTQYLSSTATLSGSGTALFASGYTEIDANPTIAKLLIASGYADFDGNIEVQEIELTGGKVDFATDFSVPTLSVSGGVLIGLADITVTNEFIWSGGQIDGSGVLNVASAATGTLTGNNVKVLDRDLHNFGSLQWNQGEFLIDVEHDGDPYGGDPYGGGTGGLGDDTAIIRFVNEVGGKLTFADNPSSSGFGSLYLKTNAAAQYDSTTFQYVPTDPPVIENLGTIIHQSTGTSQVTPEIQNQGDLTVISGKLIHHKPFVNDGDVTIERQGQLHVEGYTGELVNDPYGGDPYGGGVGVTDTRISYTQISGATNIIGGKLTAIGDAVIESGELNGVGFIGTDLVNQAQMSLAPDRGNLVVDGNFTQTATGDLYLDATSQPKPQSDSLVVNGEVNLDGQFFFGTSTLLLPPDMIHLIDNDGADAINGQFSNVSQGATVNIGGINQPYSYVGGTGNDFSFGFQLPKASATTVKLAEGQSGTTDFVFTVTLDGPYNYPVTIDYETVDTTATAGEDYIATSGTLTFNPGGPLTQAITVSVLGDLTPEKRERFSLVFSDAFNAVLEQDLTVGTILDDDGYTGALDNLGNDFWLTFPGNYYRGNLQLYITGPENAVGSVEIPGLSFIESFEVQANQITPIALPDLAELGDSVDTIEDLGIHVTADTEVAIYGLNLVPYTTDAYLGLPTDILDDKYVVLGWKNSYTFSGTQLAIVAPEDDTYVTITPTISGGSRSAGTPYTIQLNEGQTYQLRSSELPGDVSGTVITSTAPIAVFAGNQCANVPQGVTYCDYVVEQLTPTSTWGKSFVTVPLATRLNGDTFQVIASDDDTVLKVDGTVVATLDQGEIFEDVFEGFREIETSKPVFVAQYSNGQSYDGIEADPFMMLLPPTEQFLDDYTVGTPIDNVEDEYGGGYAQQFLYNFINVVVPTDSLSSVRLDGAPLDSSVTFTPIGSSGYSGAQVPVAAGSHHLKADVQFGVYSYGFSSYDSYGYPGGLALAKIADVQTLSLSPPQQTAYIQSSQSVSATVQDNNGGGLAGVLVQFTVSGANTIVGTAYTDSQGIAQFSYTGTNVGQDTILATFGSLAATAEKTWLDTTPEITILSPTPRTQFSTGASTLITGKATAFDPVIPIVAVYMDGVPVDALDADGKFFVQTSVEAANQVYSFTAIDALGNQAITTHILDTITKTRGPVDVSSLSDVSTIDVQYWVTSFNERTDRLYAELSITNTGTYTINSPLLVGVKNISSPTAFPADYDGITAQGIPYFDFSDFVLGGSLQPGQSTLRGLLQFDNPNRDAFTYELVLLGQLNQAPQFTSSPPVSITAGTPYGYQAVAVDADQDAVEYTLVVGPIGATLHAETGWLDWSPAAGDVGNHNVIIEADDGRGARTRQTYLLSVEPDTGNRPPVFSSIPITTAYVGTTYQADVTVTDPDFDVVDLDLTNTATGLTIATTGDRSAALSWTPTADQVGVHDVTIEADDLNVGGIAQQSFKIRVLPAQGNDPPQILSDPNLSATAGVQYHYPVVAIDPDDDTLLYSLSDFPVGMLIDDQSGLISWTPTSGTSGTEDVTVRVDDGQGWFVEQTYQVQWVNAAPGTLGGTVFDDTNADGNQDVGEPALAGWTVYLDANQNGKLDPSEVSQATDASGDYNFTGVSIGDYSVGLVKPTDWALNAPADRFHQGTLLGGQTITGLDFSLVTKNGGNTRPVFQSEPITTAVVGNTYRYRPTAFDADGDELTFSQAFGPQGMTIDPATGTLAWTPAADENFYVDVTLRVDDGNGGFALQPFQVFLTVAENSDPVFTSVPRGPAAVGVPWSYPAQATDPDGDTVTYSIDQASDDRSIDIVAATGMVTWTPGAVGDYTINVTASDDRGGSATQTIFLAVRDNTPPEFNGNPPIPGFVGEQYVYNFDVTDGDGDVLTLTLDATSKSRGMLLSGDAVSGFSLTWTPAAEGDFPVTLTLSDGQSRVTQVFTLPVIAPVVENLPPEITSKPIGPIYANSPTAWTYPILANDPDGDDNQLTYSLALPTSNGEVSLVGNVLSWDPANPGSETFRIVVTDQNGAGASTIQSFTATALSNRVGAWPVITSVPTGPAIRGTTYAYQVVAHDPNGDPLTYTLGQNVTGAKLNPQTGLLTFEPGAASSVDFDIEVYDGIDGTRIQSFTLDVVSPPGTPPRFTSSPVGPAISSQPWKYTVAAIDSQGDAITYTMESATSSNGTETVTFDSATRTVHWSPSAADLSITVEVTATDIDGFVTQTFSLSSIAAPVPGGGNEAPVFVSKPQGPVLVGQEWTYVAKATDADGDVVTYSLDAASETAGLKINATSGRIQWTPTATGNYQVSVSADDSNGGTATQDITITVGRSNVAPKFTSKPTGPAIALTPWVYTATATDANDPAASLTYELVSPAVGNGVSFDDATATLTWTAGTETSQVFEIKVTDPHGASATQEFQVYAVNASTTNSPPTFVSAAPTNVRAGELYQYAARAVDPNGDAVTYHLTAFPVGMTVNATTGLVSWSPSATGQVSVTLEASDGINPPVSQTFPITVDSPFQSNRPPKIHNSPTKAASRNLAWQFQIDATDPDGDTIGYSIDTSEIPASALGDLDVNATTGLVTWTPTVAGSFVFKVFATDPAGANDGLKITLPILENSPPRFTTPPPNTPLAIGTAFNHDADAVDPNGDNITYTLDQASLDRQMTINATSGVISWPSNLTTTVGVYPVNITANDGQSGIATQAFDLRLVDPSAPNTPPVIGAASIATMQIGTPFVRDLLASDADGDSLTFSLTGAPAGLSVTTTGEIQWTPDTPGQYTFTVTADDGEDTTSKEFNFTTTSGPSNTTPEINSPPNKSALAVAIYRYDVNASDADGDTLIYSLTKKPAGMQINYSTGLIQWIPQTAQIGKHEVTVSVSDLKGGVDTQTFEISVGDENRPPIIDSDAPRQAIVGQPYVYPIRATDPDGHKLTFSIDTTITTAETNGTFNIDSATGLVTWSPATIGNYLVQINVVDEYGLGVGQVFDVDVLASLPNNPPRFTSGAPPLEVSAGDVYSFDFDAMDPDGDNVTFSLTEKPTGADIDLNTGVLTWNTTGVAIGTLAYFTAVVDDGQDEAKYRYSVRVQPPNFAPYFSPEPPDQFLVAGNPMPVDIKAFDANAGDTIRYSLDPTSTAMGIEIDTVGRIRWQTGAGDVTTTPHPVTVTISDGRLSADSTFDVTINADTTGPSIQLVASQDNLNVGEYVDLRVHALDNVAVTQRTLTLLSVTQGGSTTTLNQSLSLNAAGQARLNIRAEDMGTLLFEATAQDAAGNQAIPKQLSLIVINPADTNPPTVNLLPPTGDVLAPFELLGVIDDDLPSGVNWTLTLAPADNSLGDWSRTIAEGNGLVTTATALGQFDPTILANGSYLVTLTATDAGGHTTSDSEFIDVDSDLKLGNFSLSFTDLQIPVAGIPITIIRKYDTLQANTVGEFGYGWTLEIAKPTLSVVQGSSGPPALGSRYPTFVEGTRVVVETPDGDTEGFTMHWVKSATGSFLSFAPYYRPSFIPDSGNKYSLTAPGADMTFSKLSEYGSYTVAGDTREYSAMDPYFGGAFLLTAADARTQQLSYTISTQTLTGTRVSDKYGNELRFTDEGIFSNQGRAVLFDRDWQGRIVRITDPSGGQLNYRYDTLGRLVEFYDRRGSERLTDGISGNEFQPTRFVYDIEESIRRHELAAGTPIDAPELAAIIDNLPGADNYLSRIVDPLGIDALQADYDRDGRLGGLIDAEGNPSKLNYDISSLGSTVTSSSTGIAPTSSSFDARGRLYREESASGQVTLYTYQFDASRYPYQTIQVIGEPDGADAWANRSGDDRVTTRQYHAEFEGAVTQETDPDGNTTLTAYNTWGYDKGTPDKVFNLATGETTDYHWFDLTGDGGLNLVSTTDQDGNATSYDYDSKGNVTSVRQSNENVGLVGSNTTFVYNDFGDLSAVTDADGNVRQIFYDDSGRQTGTEFIHYPGDQRPPLDPVGATVADFPPTRTIMRTANVLDAAGDVVTSYTEVMPQTLNATTLEYENDLNEPEIRNAGTLTEYDALGRAYRTTDENGRVNQTIYDARGLAIETRSESPSETGSTVSLISRSVYDSEGRTTYSTGTFPLGTDPADITGTHTIYDAEGRVEKSEQLLGLNIELVTSTLQSPTTVLAASGTVLSFSSSIYDDNDRVISTFNDYGLRSETLYDDNGRVIESRSEVVDTSSGTAVKNWMVSRTLYDTDGKVLASTDRFFVPAGTPLGNDPVSGPVTTQITKTIYDGRDRAVATERYEGGSLSLSGTFDPDGTAYHPGFAISDGTLTSVSETLYDAAGRVWRTISGRVPESTLSPTALAQSQALANFPIHGDAADPYAGQGLSSGILSDPIFDERGRQFGSLGHPLPAADIGLAGGDFDGNLVRPRTETLYNSHGQAEIQRSGLAHIVSPTNVFVSVQDNQSVDMVSQYDAFGNVVRTDYLTGGTLSSSSAQDTSHVRTGGIVDSFMMTHFDVENRPIAEMQSLPGFVTASYDPAQRTFVIDSVSTNNTPYTQNHTVNEHVPTKLYNYDSDDRLESVELPAVPDPDNSGTPTRPKYEYAYDERGNQTLIVDPLGRETRFTFTDRGQQATRTLPLGFGDDGIQGTADDASTSPFSESFTYDDRGRQVTHTSFEGIISETVYDSFGRMWAMNYYADITDQAAGLISQRDEYSFDDHGRRDVFVRYTANAPTALSAGVSASTNPAFSETRTEESVYDSRGRIEAETSAEGVLRYTYDEQGRMLSTAIADTLIAPASRVTHYEYDLLGRLSHVTEDATPAVTTDDPQVSTAYGFDLQGRARTTLTGTLVTLPSLMSVYQYDSLGRLDTLTESQISPTPNSPAPTLSSYDYKVRPDGKRTSVSETFWIDADDDGVQDAGELETTNTTWAYDDMGRLTDEVIDHWDDTFDQTESYEYDLTGNRLALDRDKGNNSTIDESVEYRYDANDRLFAELFDSTDDTTTIYDYDHTQQTAKIVYTSLLSEATIDALVDGGDDSAQQRVSSQSFTYNLQGRMNQAVIDAYDASGNLQTRTRSTYEYDHRSFRVGQYLENWNASTSQFEFESDTEFLVSHRNQTGYTQTLRETTNNADGSTKSVDYTFGNDEIAQRIVERDDQGGITSDVTHAFGHDGHGSVRVLYDLAATGDNLIQQLATYTAYGVMLAVHNGVGNALATNVWASTLSYSGEAWDSTLNRGYNRARWYDASSAQWNRLDPFSGNMQDPQSLHKYAYVHGDPVQGTDPTGLVTLISALASMTIGVSADNNHNTGVAASGTRGLHSAQKLARTFKNIGRIIEKVNDNVERAAAVVDLLDFSPSELKNTLSQLTGLQTSLNLLPNTATSLPAINIRGLKTRLKKVERKLGGILNNTQVQEALAEAMTAIVARGVGFEDVGLKHWNWSKGIDQLHYNGTLNGWGVFEAKGGYFSKLGRAQYGGGGKYYVRQFGGPWIRHWMEYTINERSNLQNPYRSKLKTAYEGGAPMLAAIVRFDLLNAHLKVTYQQYQRNWNIVWGNKY